MRPDQSGHHHWQCHLYPIATADPVALAATWLSVVWCDKHDFAERLIK
jgi:hypothetical protein